MKKYKVYILFAKDLKIKYIGITSRDLSQRLTEHIDHSLSSDEPNTYKRNWIRSVLKLRDYPNIRCIKSFDDYESAANLEELLILKYKEKHKLTNQVYRDNRSNRLIGIRSKKVYVYSYKGELIKKYPSIKTAGDEMGIYFSTIKKCITGEYKHAKEFQFSHEIKDMPDLTGYSKGSSIPIELIDNQTGASIRFRSSKECKEQLKLPNVGTSAKHIRGSINKKFGDKYRVVIDGEEKTSTYYNTGVLIIDDQGEHFFHNQKELKKVIGILGGSDRKQIVKKINKHFNNVSKIQFNCSLVK